MPVFLRAHRHQPVWIWKKKEGPNDKGNSRLNQESEAAYRAIDLHFHDLRHEAGSRLLEAGWPVHRVQHTGLLASRLPPTTGTP